MRPLIGRPIPGLPSGVEVHDTLATSGTGRSVRVRVYLPTDGATPLPTLLWIHGGGLISGCHINDRRCGHLARELGIAVVSATYSFAPEHPYPAALDDLATVVDWIRSDPSERGFDPSRLTIGGASAGGGLAASMTQRLHDVGEGVVGQLLVYPMLDDRTAARTDIGRNEHLLWTNGSNHTGWQAYLGTRPGDPHVPPGAVPARRDDLSGLPPAWIGIGTLDLFHDECLTYAHRLGEAGADCTLEVVDGGFHGFDELAHSASVTRGFVESQVAFLASVFGQD